MKRILYIFFAEICSLLCFSCCQDKSNLELERVNDDIRGQYKCVSIEWTGNPSRVDLNNDSVSSSNLITEYNGLEFSEAIIKQGVKIYPLKEYDTMSSFTIEIPMQDIIYDKAEGKYNTGYNIEGREAFLPFYYSVNAAGDLTVIPRETSEDNYDVDGDYIDKVTIRQTKALSITIGNGKIFMDVDYCCYDFATQELIKGIAKFSYERTTFAL